jgi:hypothetical protein
MIVRRGWIDGDRDIVGDRDEVDPLRNGLI